VEAEVADVLVQRMAAERISRRVVRLLPPDSVFLPAKNFPQTHYQPDQPLGLPPAELPGLHFVHPDPVAYRRMLRAEALLVVSEYVWQDNLATTAGVSTAVQA
jgi:hypothetical protein